MKMEVMIFVAIFSMMLVGLTSAQVFLPYEQKNVPNVKIGEGCFGNEILIANGSCVSLEDIIFNISSLINDSQKTTSNADPFLFNNTDTIFFNATFLNDSVEDLIGPHTIDTQKTTSSTDPYLFNDTVSIFFNESFLNLSIQDLIGPHTNDTQKTTSSTDPFLFNDTITIFFNGSFLNDTVEDLIGPHTIDTQKTTSGSDPYLFNDTISIFFNESFLNLSIQDLIGPHTNDTQKDTSSTDPFLFNDTVTIFFNSSFLNDSVEDLIGPHTNDSQKTTSNSDPFLFNNTDTIFFNESFLNDTIEDLVGPHSNDSQKTTSNADPYLFNDTVTIFFNESYLNGTIANIINTTVVPSVWTKVLNFIFQTSINDSVGISETTPDANFEIARIETIEGIDVCIGLFKNPIACYRFEESNGTTAIDSSFNSNDGLIIDAEHNESKGTNGTGNFSLKFFKTGDRVSISTIPEIELVDDFTISTWVKVNESEQDSDEDTLSIAYKNHDGSNLFSLKLEEKENKHKVVFAVKDGGSNEAEQTLDQNVFNMTNWTHILVTKESSTLLIYVNGVLESSTSASLNQLGVSTDLFIGNDADLQDDFNGNIDEFMIFNTTLNQTEVTDIYNNGISIEELVLSVTGVRDVFLVSSNSDNESDGNYMVVKDDGKVGIRQQNPTEEIHFGEDALFDGDVQITGTLIGGSPLKIFGGLDVQSGGSTLKGGLDISGGDIENANRIFSNNITSDNAITAVQFIDLTPAYNKNTSEALRELTVISNRSEGGRNRINHSSLPDFVSRNTVIRNESGDKVVVEGRDIGSLVTMIVESIKELKLQNDLLKSELCRKDNSYRWC